MKSYFIPADLQKRRQATSYFPAVTEFQLNNVDGILVEEGQLQEVLTSLELRLVGEEASEYQELFVAATASIRRMETNATSTVTFEQWDTVKTRFVRAATKDFGNALLPMRGNVVVVLHEGRGQPFRPITDGRFHIWFWSGPVGRPSVMTPRSMWGIPVSSTDLSFPPSGAGQIIRDDAYNAIGEILQDNLYIFHNLLGTSRGVEEEELYRNILSLAQEQLTGLGPVQTPDRVAVEPKPVQNLNRDAFIKMCVDNRMKGLSDAQRKLTAARGDREAAQEALTKAIRAEQEAQRAVTLFEEAEKDQLVLLGAEFDNLLSHPDVRGVQTTDRSIIVFTKMLYCEDPRTRITHEIGEFEIHLLLTPDEAGHPVLWFNKTRRINGGRVGMNAPHVDADGHACLGNMKDALPDLIKRREFAVAATVAIKFVQSVNIEDQWGKAISKWPIAPSPAVRR